MIALLHFHWLLEITELKQNFYPVTFVIIRPFHTIFICQFKVIDCIDFHHLLLQVGQILWKKKRSRIIICSWEIPEAVVSSSQYHNLHIFFVSHLLSFQTYVLDLLLLKSLVTGSKNFFISSWDRLIL